MNTAEMWVKAQEDGKTYKCNNIQYNKKKGFHGLQIGLWPANSFDYIDDIFNLNWQLKPDNEMTKSEAEAKFNIKEAENELEAKKEALLDIGFCFDSYRVVGIECFDEEDE